MDGRTQGKHIRYVDIASASPEHPRNDSASVVELPDGALLMVHNQMQPSAFGGNDRAPSWIVSRRSTDGGLSWSSARVEVKPAAGEHSIFNPSLHVLETGEILFFYVVFHQLRWNKALISSGRLRRSNDGGQTWEQLPPLWDHDAYNCANHTLIQLPAGRLLKSVEHLPIWGSYPSCVSASGAFISDNEGTSWQPPTTDALVRLPLRGCMENHLAPAPDGSLVMVVRNQLGSVFLARSHDQGHTWSKPQTTGLRAPESMPSLTRLPAGDDLLLVWNDSDFDPEFDHSGRRSPLGVATSSDSGRTWRRQGLIEDAPSIEFSNVACTHLSNGNILITYLTSPMEDPAPPGKPGRTAMSLKGALLADLGHIG